MALRYRIGRSDRDSSSAPYSLPRILEEARRRAVRHGKPYRRCKPTGAPLDYGPSVSLPRLLGGLSRALRALSVGEGTCFTAGGVEYRIRKVRRRLRSPFALDGANSKVRHFVNAVVQRFPDLESWGIAVCKFIAGTRIPSQHCPFPGPDPGANAIDVHLDSTKGQDSVGRMWDLANWIVMREGDLELHRLIFRDRIWTTEAGWHPYTDIFHAAHIHLDFLPERQGLPPCLR